MAVDSIQDRPLTWDWQGTVRLFKEAPDSPLSDCLKLMRSGDYYLAYVTARNDLRAHSDRFVDVWVMAESARKRNAAAELARDSIALLAERRTPATIALRVRALGLEGVQAVRDHKLDRNLAVSKEETPLLKELLLPAESEICPLVLEMSYGSSYIAATRKAAQAFAAKHASDVEIQLLVARTLVRGDFGYPTVPGQNKLGRAIPGPVPPLYDDALSELDRIERTFGKHPLIDYYRSVGWAMKAEVANPKFVDIDAAKREAIRWATQFVEEGNNYPRLVPLCRKFLAKPSVVWFFPQKDE